MNPGDKVFVRSKSVDSKTGEMSDRWIAGEVCSGSTTDSINVRCLWEGKRQIVSVPDADVWAMREDR